jgi:hypothetical protein
MSRVRDVPIRLIPRGRPNQGHQDARIESAPPGAASQAGVNMIIVSKPSAEATQPVRAGRYTSACRRSSAARNDTRRYAEVRRISVHTEEVTGSTPAPQRPHITTEEVPALARHTDETRPRQGLIWGLSR